MKKVCTVCGYVGESTRVTKGSFIIEVFLWLLLFVPGFIYSLWRLTSKFDACPKCNNPGMIPSDSPIAKKFLDEAKLFKNDQKSYMKNCPKCGKIYDDTWAVCLNCDCKLIICEDSSVKKKSLIDN